MHFNVKILNYENIFSDSKVYDADTITMMLDFRVGYNFCRRIVRFP